MTDDDWSMDDLMAEFQERLAADHVAVAELWEDAQNPARRDAALTDLESVAHKLAGLGRTFGFPEVTDAGRALEIALVHRDRAAAPPPQTIAAVEAFHRAIAAAIAPESRRNRGDGGHR